MGRANTGGGRNQPQGQKAWKYCTRCSSNVKDLDNHSKLVDGVMVPCK